MKNIEKIRKIAAGALALSAASALFSLGVDERELRSVNGTVVFENYTGPHSAVDTLDQIRQIGRGLGRTVAANAASPRTAGNSAKYYVIHAIDSSTKEKLDADILILGRDAAVDHIRNLRHIIAGYLSAAYGYSEGDAETVATFVTVYNAVYRKNMGAFSSKYKEVVTKNLSSDKAGLSTKWSEWAGNSQIVIPVSDVQGGISSVDTSVISDKEVIKSMQEDDDKNIEARKDMVDLKEREADAAGEKAQEQQKKATEEQGKASEQQRKADEAQKDADKAQKDADRAQRKADEAQKKADENPSDKEAQKDADKAQKDADKAQKDADRAQKDADEQQKKADEQQKKADEASQSASEQQALSDKKQSEAQEERKSIAQDQQSVERAQDAAASTPGVYGLTLTSAGNLDSTIVKVSTKDGSVLQKSQVNVIKGRIMHESSGGFIAVAGQNTGAGGAVKLVIIDQKSLEITKESSETLADNSALLQDGGSYLVVMRDGSNYVVAKYDANLKLVTKSPVSVSANSPIVKTSAGYMVTDSSGVPVILNASDLSAAIK